MSLQDFLDFIGRPGAALRSGLKGNIGGTARQNSRTMISVSKSMRWPSVSTRPSPRTLLVCRPRPGTACRYATLGFEDAARLDDGPMWPTSSALVDWSPAAEQRVAALVRAAAS